MGSVEGKHVLITGGTGSLGQVLTRRLLSGEKGRPSKITILSRDEAKQHAMRVEYTSRLARTDPGLAQNYQELLRFRLGDVRDFDSVSMALKGVDIVFNAAALKQVPACEYFPYQAVQTNIVGPVNIVRAIHEHHLPVESVISVSTDKACKPVNVMGMTKAIQERVFVQANLDCPETRFVCVRYGNVLASRGSVIPLFHEQIRNGGPVTITTRAMTRFLLSLNQAVDLIFAALKNGKPGEIYIPRVPAARIIDVAHVLIGDRKIETAVIGVRPGEKTHEILVSEEEVYRTIRRDDYYVVLPSLDELRDNTTIELALTKEYSSDDTLLSLQEVKQLLLDNDLLFANDRVQGELLR